MMKWFAKVGSHPDLIQDCINHARATGSTGDIQSWVTVTGRVFKWADVRREGYLEDGVEYFEVRDENEVS